MENIKKPDLSAEYENKLYSKIKFYSKTCFNTQGSENVICMIFINQFLLYQFHGKRKTIIDGYLLRSSGNG